MAETGLMRIRIQSDGTAGGTTVTDAESGKVIPVSAVTWSLDARQGEGPAGSGRLATATITVPVFVSLDVRAAAHLAVDALGITATSAVPPPPRSGDAGPPFVEAKESATHGS